MCCGSANTEGDVQYFEFQLDSSDASNPFSDGYTYRDWPIFKIGGKRPLQSIAGLKIIEAQIPFSWYMFKQGDSVYIENMFNNALSEPLVFDEGNYSVDEIVQKFKLGSPYGFRYNRATQKLQVINQTAAPDHPLKVTVSDIRLATMMGAEVNTPYFSKPRDLGDGVNDRAVIEFPYIAQLTGPNYLYICSQKIGNLTNLYLPQTARLNEGNSGPELAKIPINVLPGDVIFWQDPDPTKYFDLENTQNLTEIDIYLSISPTGPPLPLELNGSSFSLKVGLLQKTLSKTREFSGTCNSGRVVKRVRPE